MKKVKCIFCGQEREKAKEHIVPRWLQIEVGGSMAKYATGTHIKYFDVEPIDERKQSGESFVFGSVCKECNGGWMSQLENECKPIIQSLLKKSLLFTDLDKKQRLTLALWSFKTALMINAGSNYRRIVPESHYAHLYKHQGLVQNMKVDVAYIQPKEEINFRQSSFEAGLAGSQEKQPEFHSLMRSSYKITITIKSIGIRVSYFPEAKQQGYKLQVSDKDKTLRIWSYSKNPHFIPKLSFDDVTHFHLNILPIPKHL